MSLPNVKILFENGQLGATSPSNDGIVGLIGSGAAVVGKFALNTAYLLTSLSDLTAFGITSDAADANAVIYKAVSQFYSEAPAASKMWLMAFDPATSMADLMDVTKNNAKALIQAANGAINLLIVAKGDPAAYAPVILNGLDSDVFSAMTNAQALAEWATTSLYAPFFVVLEGRHYSGTASALQDLTQGTNNRVGILIGDTMLSSAGAAVGVLAGRIASIPVQRSLARVKTGALNSASFYIGSVAAENGQSDVINDLGYISFRNFVGKSGYYFTDDRLATASTDDYALIPRRRVIDKAYRYAYQIMVNYLNDEIPVTDAGQIPASVVKSIQNAVEVGIEQNMTAYGNLGVDPTNPNDTGVHCYIDYAQNIVQTGNLNVTLQVKPYSYPKYITVELGFTTTTT